MKNWHTYLVILVIGFALGFSVSRVSQRYYHRGGPWKHGNMEKHLVKMFSRQLHLHKDQKAQLSTIFAAKRPQMIAIHHEMQPKFEALRQTTNEEIKKILTPDQLKKFEEMTQKWEAKMKERREDMDGPPPGP